MLDSATRTAAERATQFITGFYPGIQAAIEGGNLLLRSEGHETDQLALIWKAALANERFHERGREQRTALLQGLLN